MNFKLTLAGALALIIPTTAAVPAFAQSNNPYVNPQRGYTELRIAPPPGGQVYVYEGRRLLGRLDRPGTLLVATGRDYRVIAMRGDTQEWAGNVTALGAPLDLSWGRPVERMREPMVPPPIGRPTPPGYEQAPPYVSPTSPIMSSGELRALLRELDEDDDDHDRMDTLAEAARRRSFAVPQASWILSRFRSDAYRLVALERLRDRLVDRDDARILLQRFRSPSARQQAAEMLGW